jgi:hypothetical protein
VCDPQYDRDIERLGEFAAFVTRAAGRRGILPAMQFGRERDARTIETQR